DVSSTGLKAIATVPVGDEPRGLAYSRDTKTLYTVLSGENAVVAINTTTKKISGRTAVGAEPWHLALSPDGTRLAVGCARAQDVVVLDAANLTEVHTVRLRGRNVRHLAFSPEGDWAYVPHISERGTPVTQGNIDNGWVTASRLSRVPIKEEGPREAI